MSKLYSRLLGLGALLGMLGAGPAWAQTTRPNRCGTEEANALQQAELQRLNPGYNPARSTNSARPNPAARTNVVYTLPVVFHIIHNGEAVGTTSNISQAQVQSQLDVLNEDYRNLNADAATVVPAIYQPRRGDTQVQFVMAQRDPNGATMPEPGIDRVNRNTKGFTAPPYTMAYNQSNIKPQTFWNPEQYINIWVENLGGGLLGYAQFPDNTANLGGLNPSGGAANTDGVVILYGSCGSRLKYPAGTYVTSYDQGRTLTHELGHWFSLRHIWGDGTAATCLSDYCNDTPTQAAANFGCVAFPHVTCSNGTGDMSQNYMDYSDDRCMAMFTGDQAGRMQAVMAANTPRRSNLVNSPVACTNSVPATAVSNSPVCVGSTINLTATGPAGATYAWTGPNGFTSSSQNPTIANATAASAGAYTVSATLAGSACPNTATTTVVVNAAPPTPTITSSPTGAVCAGTAVTLSVPSGGTSGTLPSTDFNSGLPTGWAIASTGASGGQWQVTPGATYSYSGSFNLTNITLNNSRFAIANSNAGGQGTSTNTTLTTPSFSTVGYSALSLAFQHVFLPDNAGTANAGTGTVEVSTDGGTTWTAATTYTTAQGALTNTTATPVTATVNMSAYLNRADVRVRWHYTDSYGYVWAVDNVVFNSTASNYTYSYTLVSGNGLPTTTNTPSITVTPTQTSVYRLTVTGSGCSSSSTVTVNVNAGTPPATPTVTASQSLVCSGASVTLTGSNLPTGTGYAYQWSYAPGTTGGTGLPATANTPTITVNPTTNSSYVLTVTGTSACGVAVSAPVTISIIPAPVAPATPTVTASQSLVCSGASVTLTGGNLPTGTGYTYQWSYAPGTTGGTGLPATANTPIITVTPTTASSYVLTVTATNSCGVSASTSSAAVAISLIPAPVAPATPTVTASQSLVCSGASVTLTGGNLPTGTGYTYQWSYAPGTTGGTGLPATANTPTITVNPTTNSSYVLTVTATNSCGVSASTSSAAVAISLIPAPVAPAAPTFTTSIAGAAAGQNVLCGGGSATLAGVSLPTGTGYTYQWTVVANPDGTTGNGLPAVANTASITVTPTMTSTYQLTVTATNACGVSASTSSTRNLTAPTVIVASNSIQAYPVPFGDAGLTLDVSTCTPGSVSAQLYDSMGRLVYDQVIQSVPAGNNSRLILPGSQYLKGGKYTLKVQQGNQNLTFNVVRL